ncbi:MAG: MltA domain-containing protein [Rhizomicrobium sp.]
MKPRLVLALFLFLLGAGGFGVWYCLHRAPPAPEAFAPVAFADLPGWRQSDPAAALAAFRRSCMKILALPPRSAMGYAGTAADWRASCLKAAAARDPRRFFEGSFVPYPIGDAEGLVTGYYEPLLNGSATRHGVYQTPVYGPPADLVTVDLGLFRPEWKGEHIAGRVTGNRFVPYGTRAQIDAQPPATARVLFWCDDPVALFFLHIQGSGRVALDDGTVLRVTYAAQNGHPYTAIGRTLIRRGALARDHVSLQTIRAWLKSHPGEARGVMESDASFVFFEESPIGDPTLGPAGSEGVLLTPGGSVAVDAKVHPLGMPLFVAGGGVAGLFVAQDTGGAIRSARRADIFFGFGAEAEAAAGTLKAHARFYVLLPRSVVPGP